MSNTVINIRFMFWHLKRTFDGKWSVSFNRFIWSHKRLKGMIYFLQFCDFDLSFIVDKFKAPSMLILFCIITTTPLWFAWVLVGTILLFFI